MWCRRTVVHSSADIVAIRSNHVINCWNICRCTQTFCHSNALPATNSFHLCANSKIIVLETRSAVRSRKFNFNCFRLRDVMTSWKLKKKLFVIHRLTDDCIINIDADDADVQFNLKVSPNEYPCKFCGTVYGNIRARQAHMLSCGKFLCFFF